MRGRIYLAPGKEKVSYTIFPFGLETFRERLGGSYRNANPQHLQLLGANPHLTVMEGRDLSTVIPAESEKLVKLLELGPIAPPATQPAGAEQLKAAVAEILKNRGLREDETWSRLERLIEPGMTLTQVFSVFPLSVGAKTLWHAPSSSYSYKTTLKLSQAERWIEVKLSQEPQGLGKERVLVRPRVKDGPDLGKR